MKRFLLVFSSIILIDQVTKYMLSQNGGVQFNVGHAFSLGLGNGDANQAQSIIAIVTSLALLGLSAGLLYSHWRSYPGLAGLFFGGGVSNIVDRLMYGAVIDWAVVPFVPLRNNIADWAIVISCLYMVWHIMHKDHEPNHSV